MKGLRFNCNGPDAALLARLMVFLKALFAMEIFKLLPTGKLGTQEDIQKLLDAYQRWFEGGKYGDRNNIGMRRKARLELVTRVEKILHFLESVADEDDLIALQNAGVEVRRPRRKKSARPEQQQAVLALAAD